jgi:hypothetical protein
MVCSIEFKEEETSTCGAIVVCETSFEVRGMVSIVLSIPGELQTISWSVRAKTWEFYEASSRIKWVRYLTTVNKTLATGSSSQQVMKGTREKPSSFKFGLTRGCVDFVVAVAAVAAVAAVVVVLLLFFVLFHSLSVCFSLSLSLSRHLFVSSVSEK